MKLTYKKIRNLSSFTALTAISIIYAPNALAANFNNLPTIELHFENIEILRNNISKPKELEHKEPVAHEQINHSEHAPEKKENPIHHKEKNETSKKTPNKPENKIVTSDKPKTSADDNHNTIQPLKLPSSQKENVATVETEEKAATTIPAPNVTSNTAPTEQKPSVIEQPKEPITQTQPSSSTKEESKDFNIFGWSPFANKNNDKANPSQSPEIPGTQTSSDDKISNNSDNTDTLPAITPHTNLDSESSVTVENNKAASDAKKTNTEPKNVLLPTPPSAQINTEKSVPSPSTVNNATSTPTPPALAITTNVPEEDQSKPSDTLITTPPAAVEIPKLPAEVNMPVNNNITKPSENNTNDDIKQDPQNQSNIPSIPALIPPTIQQQPTSEQVKIEPSLPSVKAPLASEETQPKPADNSIPLPAAPVDLQQSNVKSDNISNNDQTKLAETQPDQPLDNKVLQGKSLSISFKPGKTDLNDIQIAKLKEYADYLKENREKKIKIIGYATSTDKNDQSSSRRMSLQRVIVVRKFMIEHAIEAERMNVQAIGNAPETMQDKDKVDILTAER